MSFLRARLDQYPKLYGRLVTRAYVQLVLGTIALVISAFLSFVGLMLALMPEGGLWENRASYVVGVLGGLLPLAGAIIGIWRGLVGRKRAHTARDIVALARLTPVFGSRDVAHHLGLGAMAAERAVLDALALGFLEEAPGLPEHAASSMSGGVGTFGVGHLSRAPICKRQGRDMQGLRERTERIPSSGTLRW